MYTHGNALSNVWPTTTATGVGSATEVPTSNGQLAGALGTLDQSIRSLGEILAQFGNQLGPVLQQMPAASTGPNAPVPPQTQILNIVQDMISRVEYQSEHVRDLSRRLVV